jgi:DNA-binding NarL/FixJ family response regulator
MPDTRVLIVAPPSLSQLLQRTVSTAENGSGIHVTDIAATAAEAIALMAVNPPDILLIDLSENSAEGLQTVQTLRGCNSQAIILAHVHAIDEALIWQAIRLGVMGFVSVQEEIVAALHTLQQGDPYLPPPAARQFVLSLQHAKTQCVS